MRNLLPMRRRLDYVFREHDARELVVSRDPDMVRIIVVAGEDQYDGGIVTDKDVLDVFRETECAVYFKPNTVDASLAEHVWEHLDCSAVFVAAQYCFKYLKPDGYIRVAVPDGLHPDIDAINRVKPGGWGPGLDDRQVLSRYVTLKTVFASKQGRTNPKRGKRRCKRYETRTLEHPQSEGNLAFADESLGVLQEPKAKPRSPVLAVVAGMPEENSETHALAPATGIIVGVGLSIMLWSFIIFVVFWIR